MIMIIKQFVRFIIFHISRRHGESLPLVSTIAKEKANGSTDPDRTAASLQRIDIGRKFSSKLLFRVFLFMHSFVVKYIQVLLLLLLFNLNI